MVVGWAIVRKRAIVQENARECKRAREQERTRKDEFKSAGGAFSDLYEELSARDKQGDGWAERLWKVRLELRNVFGEWTR